jgi:hypothetical protein
MPFVLEQFQEGTTRVVTQAKAEIDAFTMHVVQSAGFEALKSGHIPSLLGDVKGKK